MDRLFTTNLELGTTWFPIDQIYVSVKSSEINTNNIAALAPYILTELNGEPFKIPEYDKTKKMCDLCFRTFDGWSKLYAHQGKLCYLEPIVDPHPIKVTFDKSQLFFVQDCLKSLGKELTETSDGKSASLEIDAAHVSILLRQMYTCQVTKYNIEHWYHDLAKCNTPTRTVTAPTIFLDLTDEELNCIRAISKTKLAENIGMERRLTNEEMQAEDNFLLRLQGLLDPYEGKEFFCRFSTRSPKDAVSVPKETWDQLDIVQRLQAKLELLCVTNAQQILTLLTKSQRIFSDINFYYQYRVPDTSSSKLCLILRDFVRDLPVDHEFRCFVRNKKMTAISQYYCYHTWPALQDRNHVLQCRDAMVNFHNSISHAISMPDYVIDFVVYPDFQCHIIELNPFGAAMSSGSALFHWLKDYKLLYDEMGLDNAVIRVVEHMENDDL